MALNFMPTAGTSCAFAVVSPFPLSRNAGNTTLSSFSPQIGKPQGSVNSNVILKKRFGGNKSTFLVSRQWTSAPCRFSVSASAEKTEEKAAAGPAKTKEDFLEDIKKAFEKNDVAALSSTLDGMKAAGLAKLWASYPSVSSRTVPLFELKQIGIKNPEGLGGGSTPKNEKDAVISYIAGISVLAVIATALPGDWGYFVPYLIGSSVLVLLGIGSTAPGLLQVPIDRFKRLSPDYKKRILLHEASHFLAGYLLGIPIKGYTLEAQTVSVQLWDEDVSTRLQAGTLTPLDLDRYSVVTMAGIAGEGLNYEDVRGGQADLAKLQGLFNTAKFSRNRKDQENQTRWGVLMAAVLVKSNIKALEALTQAMEAGKSVPECILAIESAS